MRPWRAVRSSHGFVCNTALARALQLASELCAIKSSAILQRQVRIYFSDGFHPQVRAAGECLWLCFSFLNTQHLLRRLARAIRGPANHCRHYHRAALADSMDVVKSAAVIIRRNGYRERNCQAMSVDVVIRSRRSLSRLTRYARWCTRARLIYISSSGIAFVMKFFGDVSEENRLCFQLR